MKKLTLLSIFVLCCFACKKDVKFCWKCTTVTNVSTYSNGRWTASAPASHSFSQCDKTEDEINQVEKDGSHVKTTQNQTISELTTCSR